MSTSLAAALAHPGHGTTDPSSWAHYLTEPGHVATVAAVLAVAVLLIVALRRSVGARDDR